MLKIKVQKQWYSIKECQKNKKTLYVFGDNLSRYGNAGQATIRPIPNSFGFATKNKPSLTSDSFFMDDDKYFLIVDSEIEKLVNESSHYDILVFPGDGLGTGLSAMPTKAPKVFQYMVDKLESTFNFKWGN